MEIVFEVDDLLSTMPGIEYLQKIKNHFPNFKCTAFTIPFNKKLLTKEIRVEKEKEWTALLREYDWIEIAIHGFAHEKREMMIPEYDKAKTVIKAAEGMFSEKNLNLPYKKIFRAPFWQISTQTIEALRDMGYIIAINPEEPIPDVKDARYYMWNWSIEKPIPDLPIVKAHGHVFGTNNGLEVALPNVLKEMPTDAEFLFVSEYMDKYEK